MNPPTAIPVLLVVRELGIGGCERDLTKVAISLDRSQFQPYVGCFRAQGLRTAELNAHNIPIVEFDVPSFASLTALKSAIKMGAFIKARGIQIVHAFDAPADMFAVPVARLYGTPGVIASELSYRHLIRSSANRRLLQLSEKFAHKIVVNSAAVKADLVEHANVSPAKIFLSHNGVDLSAFAPDPRVRKVFPDASVIVGAVCALRPEKRLDLLIEAFSRVKSQADGLRLLIVGSGPMLDPLKQQASALNLNAFCHFEPSKTEVAEWLRTIDVFVMSSESESFPNAPPRSHGLRLLRNRFSRRGCPRTYLS